MQLTYITDVYYARGSRLQAPSPDQGRSFAERLAQARRALSTREWRDVSQVDVAEMVGTSAATVSRWESGDVVPRGPALRLLAQVLGVNLRWLETGEGPMLAQVASPEPAVSDNRPKRREAPDTVDDDDPFLPGQQDITEAPSSSGKLKRGEGT